MSTLYTDVLTMAEVSLLAAAAASGLMKSIYGGIQSMRASRQINKVLKNQPTPYVPEAIQKFAQEPVSERLIQLQNEQRARRTSQAIQAFSQMGARGAQGITSVLDNERAFESSVVAGYDQQRANALRLLGQAQDVRQLRDMELWRMSLKAALQERLAGAKNIESGISDVMTGFVYDSLLNK